MKIKEYIKESKLWFILASYVFILVLIIFKSDLILNYLNKVYTLFEPVFLGLGIAYILNIPMVKIENFISIKFKNNKFINKQKRSISILFSVILMILIITFLAIMILPGLISSIGGLISNLTSLINNAINNLHGILSFLNININSLDSKQIEDIAKNLGINYKELLNQSTKWVSSIGINIFDILSSGATLMTDLFFGFMISLYLLSSKEELLKQLKMVIACIFSKETTLELFSFATKTNKIFKSFVGGQLVECFIIGFMMYIPLALFNFPYALLIASITTICAIIPIFGAMISWVIGFILVLSVDPYKAFAFLFIYQIIQQIENNLVYPKVVGESVGLPPLWTLLSITIFGGLYGLQGLLLAVPITASLYSYFSDIIHKKLKKKNITIINNDLIIDNKN